MRHKLFSVIVILAVVATACSVADLAVETEPPVARGPETPPDDEVPEEPPDEPPVDDPSPDAPPPPGGPEPTFTEASCDFGVPDGADITCGFVEVSEDRADPSAGTIELAVALMRSTADDPAPDPVIYLEGGPGGHALDTLEFVYDDRYVPLLERGDVIVFDQRGVGRSRPALSCPEADAVYDQFEAEPDLDEAEYKSRLLDGYQQCRDRLTADGAVLSAYNSVESAADIDAIRQALGYEQLNLFGISYGTRLSLTTMRLFPESVRSAVLDSTLPPEVDATAATQQSLVASYDRFIAACDADSACNTQFPDLDDRIRSLAGELDSNPLPAEATNFLDGETEAVLVDGDVLVNTIFNSLYDPVAFTDLPEMVVDLEAGGTAAIEQYLSLELTNEAFFSVGMFLSVACHEEVALSDPTAVAESAPSDPFWERFLATSENVGPFAFEVCEIWNSGVASEAEAEPVTGSTPTLFLAGSFDPVTPLQWAETAAGALDDAQVVQFPAGSHGVTSDTCGMDLTVAFITDPTAALDTSCASADETPTFVGGPSEPIELEEFEERIDDFGVVVTSVRPVGWPVDVSGIQASRLDGVLDDTAIVQLGFDEGFVDQLANLVGAELDIVVSPEGVVDVGGRQWRQLRGISPTGVTMDVFAEDVAGTVPIVILISNEVERDELFTSVLEPALIAIEVRDA